MKRLFLFSSFDAQNQISEPLVYYLRHLSAFGDIVFVADNALDNAERAKIAPYVLHIIANGHHGEYDWGSYKRGYQWARETGVWPNYDRIYCANDSMLLLSPHGITVDAALERVFDKIERGDVGSVYYMKSKINNRFISKVILRKLFWNSVMQSWFVGIDRKFADMEWFERFITAVGPITTKRDFISRYEVRFSHICKKHKLKKSSFLSGFKNWPFREPLWLYRHGAPFAKKNAIGHQRSKVNIREFINLGTPETDMFLNDLRRQLGPDEFQRLSKRNRPHVYKRFLFVSQRKDYDENDCYICDYFLFRWRIFRKAICE